MKTVTFDESVWQLVPVEPTAEMLLAAAGEVHSATYWGSAYLAMLAAAPKPEIKK